MLEITFEVFDTIKHLESFWKESDALASAMIADGRLPRIEYTFYQTFRWNEFVERYYSSQPAVRLGLKHIEYILVRKDGKAMAILPLMVYKSSKVEMTSWRTSGINNVVSVYNNERHADVFKALIGYIRGRYHGKKLRLFELPPSTPSGAATTYPFPILRISMPTICRSTRNCATTSRPAATISPTAI